MTYLLFVGLLMLLVGLLAQGIVLTIVVKRMRAMERRERPHRHASAADGRGNNWTLPRWIPKRSATIAAGAVMVLGLGTWAIAQNLSVEGNVNAGETNSVHSFMGKVGIGTATPDDIVHIQGSDSVRLKIEANIDDNIDDFPATTLWAGGELYGHFLAFPTGYAGNPSRANFVEIGAQKDNVGKIALMTRTAGGLKQRLVVLNNGNIGIGTTNPQTKLDVVGTTAGVDLAMRLGTVPVRVFEFQTPSYSNSGNSYKLKINFKGSGGYPTNDNLLVIDRTGNVTGRYGNYHVASDERLKKDTVTIPDALEKVLALRGVNFRWKDGSDNGTLQMGMIAQEVENIIPEVVHTSDDKLKTKGVEYQYLSGLFVEAIKEQQKEIEELKARLDTDQRADINLRAQQVFETVRARQNASLDGR